MTTRREFLKQSSIIVAGAMLASNPAVNILKKKSVIIIGAGFSGLSAAHMLKQNGYDVTILEARNRISGRVFSYKIDEGNSDLVVELGAEWVGASHERIIAMCKEFGLELFNNQFESHLIYDNVYYKKNEWSYSPEWKAKFDRIVADYHKQKDNARYQKKMDNMDWWRFLMNNDIPQKDLEYREYLDSTDFGESIRFVSAYAALAEYAESSEHNEMDYKIRGGNSRLADELALRIGMENIKLNSPVADVIQRSSGVDIYCKDGSNYKADKVICAVPTYSMSKIKWTPVLPEEKIDAINALQYARINKNITLFDSRFWEDESFDMITDTLPQYFYHATKNQQSERGAITAYAIGDKADMIAKYSNQTKEKRSLETLETAFGDRSKNVIKNVNYYWGNDEYSKGAYALYGKGQWFTLRPILQEKYMNAHFSGEHVADWQGFMEGAINTGEEAAQEIMG